VFDLEETEIDQRGVEMLDRVWPRWEQCISE
jgi:hypothetical protein